MADFIDDDPIRTRLGPGRWVVPIDYGQVDRLVEDARRVLDATGMPSAQMKAVKALLNRAIYGWYEAAMSNAQGSAPGSGFRPHRVPDERGGPSIEETFRFVPHHDDPDAVVPSWGGSTGAQGPAITSGMLPSRSVVGSPPDIWDEFLWPAVRHALLAAPPYFPSPEKGRAIEVELGEVGILDTTT